MAANRVRERRAVLARAWAAAGRDPATLRLSVMTGLVVGCDRKDASARRRRLAVLRGHDELPESWIHGTLEETATQLGELAKAGVDRVMLQLLLHD